MGKAACRVGFRADFCNLKMPFNRTSTKFSPYSWAHSARINFTIPCCFTFTIMACAYNFIGESWVLHRYSRVCHKADPQTVWPAFGWSFVAMDTFACAVKHSIFILFFRIINACITCVNGWRWTIDFSHNASHRICIGTCLYRFSSAWYPPVFACLLRFRIFALRPRVYPNLFCSIDQCYDGNPEPFVAARNGGVFITDADLWRIRVCARISGSSWFSWLGTSAVFTLHCPVTYLHR